jgi:anoctamin-10
MSRSSSSRSVAEAFPRVKGIFPPHDQNFNREWLTTWTTSASAFAIPEEQLNRVKNHFGENIALYFEFLRLYFAALSLPAGLGFLFWWLDFTYSPVYSILLVAWSLLFVEGWRYREEILAVRWGTKNANAMGRRRAQFKGDRLTEDSVTGRRKRAQIWWKKESRILSTIPIIVAFGAGLSLLITSIFFTEVMINEVYSGKGKQYLSLLPTVLFAGLVPRVSLCLCYAPPSDFAFRS